MQCFEAISIFRVARCFRCHCHFLLGQTLGIHFRRRPLSTIESMPGQRHGVSKEKDEHFPFSRINQAAPDVAIFFAPIPSHPGRVFIGCASARFISGSQRCDRTQDMQCFEAISIFRVARCFRCHCHFLLGQTLGIHFRRRPLSTIESMPGQRHGVSKEKDEHFPFSRINQAAPDVAIFRKRMGTSLQKSASIRPRTSPPKFQV